MSRKKGSALISKCQKYLKALCLDIPERPTGSDGNRQATSYFIDQISRYGWDVHSTRFSAMDWEEGGAELIIGGREIEAFPSPFSLGCELEGDLVAAGNLGELMAVECRGRILLLHSDLTKEQLMPKNFVFYNPPEHQEIIQTLEEKNPAAILCATSRNAALAGGVYPFPFIEDGDFNIPSLYLTEEIGAELIDMEGERVDLKSYAARKKRDGFNVVAKKGRNPNQRIVVTAHIDAKKGTPGAIDNGTGVIVLLLLAELLADYEGTPVIELVPFNGEDYFAASGQMLYLEQNTDKFSQIILNINIDGAGYHQGPSAFSLFDLPDALLQILKDVIEGSENIIEGIPWYQGDHSIFLQQGVPAVAVSSKWFIDHVDQQEITHTPKDHPDIVDCHKVVEVSLAIQKIIQMIAETRSG
jgi:aminopeptidase YwaD